MPETTTDYPALLADVQAAVERPEPFGIALATLDGDVYGAGAWEAPFAIQSISKVFSLAIAVARDGDAIWERVGREPSGSSFDSLTDLEAGRGIPRNPFVNAGAHVLTDHLLDGGDAYGPVRDLLRRESGAQHVAADPEVVAAEEAGGHRNAALAHLTASFGNLRHPVGQVLDHYFRQCAIRMSCGELALAGTFLARHGIARDGERILSASAAKRINAVMLTCGTYDTAGEFAYRVGLPSKNGVGGGILSIVPDRCALCTWGPTLDAWGTSTAGIDALDAFTTRTGWSVF
jgi:glutaminase